MRQRAGELQVRIKEYRSQQANRVSRLNADYAETFTRLMDELEDATTRELDLARDADAQRIADRLISRFTDASLRGDFRSSFAAAVAEQRARVARADEAIARARIAYEQSYQEASLDLAKLDKIQEHLASLSQRADDRKVAADFIQHVLDAYQKLKKEAEDGQKTPTAAPKTPA
jgi:hypothetical protein